MKSRNIAIITNAGGPGIIATDAVIDSGMVMAQFGKTTKSRLEKNLPPAANTHNPVDVIGDAKADRYQVAIETVMKDENVGAVIVILTPQTMTEPKKTAEIIVKMKKKFPKKPIVASFIGGQHVDSSISFLRKSGVAHFSFPGRAATALSKLNKFSELPKPVGKKLRDYLPFKVSAGKKAAVTKILQKSRQNLRPKHCYEILKNYGIEMPREACAQDEKAAIKVVEKIGFPVAMKIVSAEILHKTDVGGVKIDVKNEKELKSAFREIMKSVKKSYPKAKIDGILIQKMLPVGREIIIGTKRDANFGPLIAFGLGGIYVNIFNDATFRLAPVTLSMAETMIGEIKAVKLLRGVRGEKAVNIKALAKILVRISALATDFPEISEIDFNPVIATEKSAIVADAKILTINPSTLKLRRAGNK